MDGLPSLAASSLPASGNVRFTDLPDVIPHSIVSAKKDELFRQGLLELVRLHFTEQRIKIEREFMAHRQVNEALKAHTELMDNIILWLYEAAMARARQQHRLSKGRDQSFAIIATGGYGRQELFPHSDIDLLIVHELSSPELLEQLTEPLLYVLWDLGLKVGQAVRNIEEARQSMSDHTILSSMLDARFLAGDESLFIRLWEDYRQGIGPVEAIAFVDAKLSERDARHIKMGDTRYILEPNIKDGKGGLRDLHSLYWIARYVYHIGKMEDLVGRGVLTATEYKRFAKAIDFLFTVRMYLHYLAGRSEDRLTFEMQRSIAAALGYRGRTPNQAVERFMKHYFQIARDVGFLTSVFCAVLEEEQKYSPKFSLARWLTAGRRVDGFHVEGTRITIASPKEIQKHPERMMHLFYTAAREQLNIHPQALKTVSRNLKWLDAKFRAKPEAITLFRTILEDTKYGELTLRMMKEAGVLARFMPDFAKISGQMQFDMYHIYTVDEHTLTALGILYNIKENKHTKDLPLASRIIKQVESLRVLYLAMLCHDIAKGSGGKHEAKGEKIALAYAKQFGFTEEEQQLTGWLVKHQALFSDTAFKRDLSDPASIHYFAERVQSPEKLRLLLLLSVADIRAVGPTVWNGWKASLMRELFKKTESFLQTGALPSAPGERDAIQAEMKPLLPRWPQSRIDVYLANCPEEQLFSRTPAEHATIAALIHRIGTEKSEFALAFSTEAEESITQIVFAGSDRIGLMADIAGALAISGIYILGARIWTMKDGTAVQFWLVQNIDRQPLDESLYRPLLERTVTEIFSGRTTTEKQLEKRRKPARKSELFEVKGQVFFENHQSGTFTIAEVNGQDRQGVLHAICRALQEQRVNIASAHINTYGAEVVDVFYIKDNFGFKITHSQRLAQIRAAVLDAMAIPTIPA